MAWRNFSWRSRFSRHIGNFRRIWGLLAIGETGNPHLGIFGDPRKRGEHGGIAPTDDVLKGKYRFV
jgi:hypothetical protein